MAEIPPLVVKGMYDGTDLQAGLQTAEGDIEALADATDVAATQMRDSLSDVGDSVDMSASVADVDNAGRSMKETGTEVGAEFSENLGEAFRSGDYKALIFESLTSLGPALGPLGIGVGVGAALMLNIVKGVETKRQEMLTSIQSLFDSIEVQAGKTSREIRDDLIAAFDFQDALTQLGGEGGFNEGMRQVELAVEGTGIGFNKIVDALRTGITPETQNVYDKLIAWEDSQQNILEGAGFYEKALDDTSKVADNLTDAIEDQGVALDRTVDQQQRNAGYIEYQARQTERMAAAMAAAAASAADLGASVGAAARDAAQLALDLNGASNG